MGKPIGTILLLFVAVQAAYVEDIIWVCDSTHTLGPAHALLVNPVDSTVWQASGDLTVLDRDLTRTLKWVVPVYSSWSLCYNSHDRKLYAADEHRDKFWVVDAVTREVIASMPVDADPIRLLYNEDRNVVYCVSEEGNSVTVVCGSGDSILGVIPVGSYPREICLDPGFRRLYVGSRNSPDVYVIDSEADTVICVIPLSHAVGFAACNPREHKVYLAGQSVTVLDGRGDSILVNVPTNGVWGLAFDPVGNKMYATTPGEIVVLDCASDSTWSVPITRWWKPILPVIDTIQRKLYAFDDRHIYGLVLDTRADTLIRTLYLDVAARASQYAFGRVYVASQERCILLAIDPATDQVVGSIQSHNWPSGIVDHPQSGSVYCWSEDGLSALAIDPATNRVTGAIGIAPFPRCFEAVADGAKFYSGGDLEDGCWVVRDAVTGERLKTVEYDSRSPQQFADYPAAGLVYGLFRWASWHQTWVIDAVTDSIIDSLDLGRWQETQACADCGRMYFLRRAGDMLVGVDVAVNQVTSTIQSGSGGHLAYDAARSRLYLTRPDSGDVLVVDASGDSVVATIGGVGDGPNEMVLSTRDDRLFVANDVTGDVTVIDAGTGAIEARVPIGIGGFKLAYDTARSRLFCLDMGRKSISVLDCASLELVDSVQVDSTVYLLCWNQEYRRLYAGGRGFVYAIREGVPAIEGRPSNVRQRLGSTVIKGMLRLPGRVPAWLLDITGRHVTDLVPGENDVSRVAPGVYFVVVEGDRAVSKVILQR